MQHGTMLSAMFSGKIAVKLDEDGYVFIDRGIDFCSVNDFQMESISKGYLIS